MCRRAVAVTLDRIVYPHQTPIREVCPMGGKHLPVSIWRKAA